MIIVHASIDENGKATGGKAGDQTGREVTERSYYPHNPVWAYVLRYPDQSVAKKACTIARKLAASNVTVGYDQSQRNTLYKALKAANWDADAVIKSGKSYETDCSAFMYAVYCCLIPDMRADGNAPTTRTMVNYFKLYGFTALTDPDICKTSDYLRIGDVLVSPGHHTAMACENGAKSGVESTEENCKVELEVIKSGSKGAEVTSLQLLLNGKGDAQLVVDGDAGIRTVQAIKNWQRDHQLEQDGECGAKTWKSILG